jgi:hypothetical protein
VFNNKTAADIDMEYPRAWFGFVRTLPAEDDERKPQRVTQTPACRPSEARPPLDAEKNISISAAIRP